MKRPVLIAGSVSIIALGALIWNIGFVPKIIRKSRDLPIFGLSDRAVTRVQIHNSSTARIVAAAHAQEGDSYNASYHVISYPGGDVPKGAGACTDVVIRSLRAAGYDLQQLVHEDMELNFSKYPKKWKLQQPDKNIDHRRVPNLMTFFGKHGQSLPTSITGNTLESWQPGDIVCWQLDGGKTHIGIVSDGFNQSGVPLVIHNGWQCVEQDCLSFWPIIGHYRFPKRSA